MADDKKAEDVIELVAIERGFAMGKLIEPGKKFMFRAKDHSGKPRKLPKWAQLADIPLPKKPAAAADLKPKEAQAAVKAKAGALSGHSPGDSLA
jgi:hypothetical protein